MDDATKQPRFAQTPDTPGKSPAADQVDPAAVSDEGFTQPSLDDQAQDPASAETPENPAGAGPPPSLELAPVDPGDPSAPYRAMDRADEIQIIEEIEGRMSEVLVYKIPTGTDLSFAGVREAIRLLVENTGRQIRIGDTPPVVERYEEDGQSFVRVSVYAEDVASGQGYWGTAEQPARMKLKPDTAQRYRKSKKFVADDDTVRDEFAFTKALSKAQRNALKYFVPEQVRQGVLAIAKNDPKRLREITMGPGAPMVDAPKPLNDQGGKALISECRALYKAICDADPGFKARKPPGQFHASLQSAWSNRDALESLRDSMRDVLDKTETAA
jgi:hypothetical protein